LGTIHHVNKIFQTQPTKKIWKKGTSGITKHSQ
jgi:hypothetical protein